MGTFKAVRGVVLAACLAVALLTLVAGDAMAEASTHCVKATKVGKKYTGGWTNKSCTVTSATHEGKYEFIKSSTLSEPEQEELKALLKYVKVLPSGVDSKPTVQVSGANVQIVSGGGKTEETNGAGNLVIGYDESPGTQTGSNNLVLGGFQTYTSYGSVLGGVSNTASGPYSSVVGGAGNTASGSESSVTGGFGNTASETYASVSGGVSNKATALAASVSGGGSNTASETYASVSGGAFNKATAFEASVSGGRLNTASGERSSVSGGNKNTAEGKFSSIFGSKELKTALEYGVLPACVAPGTTGELC